MVKASMSLQYKTHAYIRQALRQAEIIQSMSGHWHASLPAFGLEVTGGDRNEAEQNLLMRLTAYVLAAPLSGSSLPIMDDIDGAGVSEDVQESEAGGHETDWDTDSCEPMTLTAHDSLTLAEAIIDSPPPNEYLLQAAREYRRFISQ